MAPPTRPGIVIGLDVGKSSHWECVVTREGELLASKPVSNRENAIDGLYAQYPGALVFVNQVRNIGSLALSRARLAGMPRQGHAARQGPEGRGEEAAQGDLRDHEGQGSVRSLTAGGAAGPARPVSVLPKTPIGRTSSSWQNHRNTPALIYQHSFRSEISRRQS